MKMVKNKRQIILDKAITKVSPRPASAANRTKTASTVNIKVVVRVRPPNTREQEENNRIVVKVINDDMLIFDPEEVQGFNFRGVRPKKKNMEFFFDKIFSTESTNVDVFKDSTYSLISSVMDGYNCSVFAYGATGAGKTFTMTGTSANPGITFLTMMELFRQQEELSSERDFELGISYLEVYNELVKDLLNPGPPLDLRDDSNYGVIVAGIKVFKISKSHELFQLLKQGNRNRTHHPTDANAEHAIFQVDIKMTMKTTKEVKTARLSMIDLAGNERGFATDYGGARFTEGANINKSLLSLGNCINSLADRQRHVPYRDSKLTRLLKDSLGGNCRTVMIANVSPSSMSFEDTYNTLKFATKAKKIKSSVHMNVANDDLNVAHVKTVEELTEENQLIKQQLKEEKEKTEMLEKITEMFKKETEMFKKETEMLEKECQRLLKVEIDGRLSDICRSSPEKTEDNTDELAEQIDDFILRARHRILCKNALFAVCGFSPSQMQNEDIPLLTGNYPAGAATKQIVHYGQEVLSGRFCQFDFGLLKNMDRYKSPITPDYDLSKISAPVTLIYGANDWLASVVDVEKLAKRLPNLKESYLVPIPTWNHLDFEFGKDAPIVVYPKIIKTLSEA